MTKIEIIRLNMKNNKKIEFKNLLLYKKIPTT